MTDMKKGNIFRMHLPQIVSTDTTEPKVVQTYIGMPMNWKAHWYGRNQTLDLIALKTFPPGVHTLTIGSEDLKLTNTIIYQNDQSMSYSIVDGSTTMSGGYFDAVTPKGLSFSSLSFGTPYGGAVTSVAIGFGSVTDFSIGDVITVYLPSFSCCFHSTNHRRLYSSNVGQAILALEGPSASSMSAVWWTKLSAIKLTVTQPIQTVDVTVAVENGLRMSLKGSNNVTGLPTISLRRNNWEYFAPTAFAQFSPAIYLVWSNISFSSPVRAGGDVQISINVAYVVTISPNDVIEIYLPQFFSTSNSFSVAGAEFRIAWFPCREILQLVATKAQPNYFSVTVGGLRLPENGISPLLARSVNISINASKGVLPFTSFHYVQLVPRFLTSSISFSPPVLKSVVSLQISFSLSANILTYDSVSIFLPGVSFPTLQLHMFSNNSDVVASWSSVYQVLTLKSFAYIPSGTIVTATFNHSVQLPLQGFPSTELPPPYIMSSGVEGSVFPTPLIAISSVGFILAEMHYIVVDVTKPLTVRLRFWISSTITVGDRIVFRSPSIACNCAVLNVTGDAADMNFLSPFTASFTPATGDFTLTAVKEIASREINVFLRSAEGLFLSHSVVNSTNHYVRGVIAKIGTIGQFHVAHFPPRIILVNPAASLNISHCSKGISCSLNVDLTVPKSIKKGDIFALSHPNFERNQQSSGSSITLQGNGSNLFIGQWRQRDNTDNLRISSSAIQLFNGGHIQAFSDVVMQNANVSLPSVNIDGNVVIVADVPRVVDVFANQSFATLMCGDWVSIYLVFSEAVTVSSNAPLKLLLNTHEFAVFTNGNGTSILQFVYLVSNPTPVLDLSVGCPAAITITRTTTISRLGYPSVPVNVTVPPPYGSLLQSNGQRSKIQVTKCDHLVSVVSVAAVGISRGTLAAGDVLDIGVIFARNVQFFGDGVLLLSGDHGTTFEAQHVNVSAIQWLEVIKDGYFQLKNGNSSTQCLQWNDTKGFVEGVTRLMSFEDSKVAVTPYVMANGLKYCLNFTGSPRLPPLLSASSSSCLPSATVTTKIDPMYYSVVTFRYIIRTGDMATTLSYVNTSSLILRPNSSIAVVGHPTSHQVSIILPVPGQLGSLSTNQISIRAVNPHVVAVYASRNSSNFVWGGSIVASGTEIYIFVNFSTAIFVVGHPYLQLNFTSYTVGAVPGQVRFFRNASFSKSAGNQLVFSYLVQVGDKARYLEVRSAKSLVLNGSSILAQSSSPTSPANLTLPTLGSASLNHQKIIILATSPPVLQHMYTDHQPGTYGTGETIIISAKFSSPVQVIPYRSGHSPWVRLHKPSNAIAIYFNGSNTNTISFSYEVSPDQSGSLSFWISSSIWQFSMVQGYFRDDHGNMWTNISYVPSDISMLSAISVDTSSPTILYVNSTNGDGVYMPGQRLDVTIVFSKSVIITGSGIPSCALFTPYQSGANSLATYYAGNGTNKIHFSYTIPLINTAVAFDPLVQLDYINSAALAEHLNGSAFLYLTSNSSTVADVMLPTADKSYLKYFRNIYINFTTPRVESVSSLNSSGIYTAGDMIVIVVKFSQPVMVIKPPVLRLKTGARDRNAVYSDGNLTHCLTFRYVVMGGDSTMKLDYVDTRFPPYSMLNFNMSLALNTDIHLTNTGRLLGNVNNQRHNDIFLLPSIYGGVFVVSDYELVGVDTSLPLPGQPGSISATSSLVLDTQMPFVTNVTTPVPSGSYGAGVAIPIFLQFNFAVVVNGCPVIKFLVEQRDKFAQYFVGSGTNILQFIYVVGSEDMIEFDYRDRFSLLLNPCPHVTGEQILISPTSIRRLSQQSVLTVNTTLPWVKYVETVIAPTSITGGGKNVTLAGSSSRVVRISTNALEMRNYTLGDVIDIYLEFNGPVKMINTTFLRLSSLPRPLFFEQFSSSTNRIAIYRFMILTNESLPILTYDNSFSLMSVSACSIFDPRSNFCAAQNLPAPSSVANDVDAVTPLSIPVAFGLSLTNITFETTEVFLGDKSSTILGIPLSKASPEWTNNSYVRSGLCDAMGGSWLYKEIVDLTASTREIITTTCPNHAIKCADSSICSSLFAVPFSSSFQIPLFPVLSTAKTVLNCTVGAIAVALNGVPFYSFIDDPAACTNISKPDLSFDSCGGSASSNEYNYRIPPTCLMAQLGDDLTSSTAGSHSPQIGWSLDGFPLYGEHGPGGVVVQPCSLLPTGNPKKIPCHDECNGYAGPLPDVDAFLYRYYITNVSVTPPCYKGCAVSDTICVKAGGIPGYVTQYIPMESFHATVVYDGTLSTTERYVMSSKQDPQLYLPSPIWDFIVVKRTVANPVFTSGLVVKVVVSFSDAIVVSGRPFLEFTLNDNSFYINFIAQLNPFELLFAFNFSSISMAGTLECTRDSKLNLNGGSIMHAANFLPLVPAFLDLGNICCTDTCALGAALIATAPFVERVFSDNPGNYAFLDQISIYVQFSGPVTVVGSPVLQLDLYSYPLATFVRKNSSNVLVFQYRVASTDFTSSLEYVDSDALQLSSGPYDGIVMEGVFGFIPANIALPRRGMIGSLGRESKIWIDNTRANLLSVSGFPLQATSGDKVYFTMTFTVPMIVVDGNGEVVKSSSPQSDLQFLVLLVVNETYSVARIADFDSVNGKLVNFVYTVIGSDPTGVFRMASQSPLKASNAYLKTASTGVMAPSRFSSSYLLASISSVDNESPHVTNIFSPNVSTTYPFGNGDVIDIYVQMSLPVVMLSRPALALNLKNRIAFAAYVPVMVNESGESVPAPFETVIHFQYTVMNGDYAAPLEYIPSGFLSNSALTGDIRRFSTVDATILANLSLPTPFTYGSLGFCCNVQVDTAEPYVKSLIPLKRPGLYGENEVIVIVARFSKPVLVTGVPTLTLDTGNGTVGVASFMKSFWAEDIPIAFQPNDVLFKYTVRRKDNILSLTHSGPNALRALPASNSSILHRTSHPISAADLTLRDPLDFGLVNGLVERQWMYRFPSKVEVILKSLYHSQPRSLTAVLNHAGQFAQIFSGVCSEQTFGQNFPQSRLQNNGTSVNFDTGIGYTYMFSDTLSPNLALMGSANQSSTTALASRAIDGNIDPILRDLSVSETNTELNPWWEVLLPVNTSVRTINIWPRKPEEWVAPVVAFTIKGLDMYPEGNFSLEISGFDTNNLLATTITGSIKMGAPAEEVKVQIEAARGIGQVMVVKKTLPVCGVLSPGGCGDGYEHGYGWTYTVTFVSIFVAAPVLQIIGVSFIGGPVVHGAIGEKLNVRKMQIISHVDVIREGHTFLLDMSSQQNLNSKPGPSKQLPQNPEYPNEWLTPFWVMLFDAAHSPPPPDINESISQALWSNRYVSVGTVKQIVLAKPFNASYVKIQMEGWGQLSLAEVEVFSDRLNTLSQYQKGSPVEASAVTNPYQPDISFAHVFKNSKFDGRWIVEITQDTSTSPETIVGWSGAYGTISDAVMVITDMSGIVHAYYQELRAEIVSLPKYGSLYNVVQHTPSPYGDWRESFEVTETGQLLPNPVARRPTGICYGVDTSSMNGVRSGVNGYRYCPNNFGVAPLINNHILGDSAEQNFIRYERMISYVPNLHYLGPDDFTYQLYDNMNVQNHITQGGILGSLNQAIVHVRNCRATAHKLSYNITSSIHPLCQCAQTELTIVADQTQCDSTRLRLCNNPSTRNDFLNMCLACSGLAIGANLAGECAVQIGRAVSLVSTRGMCSPAPPVDCTTEIITLPGTEPLLYLSLIPPVPNDAFTNLGNSFGAVGWFGSSPLP